MMKEFWDKRYSEKDYAYGIHPNQFFKQQIDQLIPGKILLPAEGEGRNAVYAAKKKWEVTAFDFSEEARNKALQLANQNRVNIDYSVHDIIEMNYPENQFDCIALIYVHLPAQLRNKFHQQLWKYLKPHGTMIIEAFHPKHLHYNNNNPKAGGPQIKELLIDENDFNIDFPNAHFEMLSSLEIENNEGNFHVGNSFVTRALIKKNIVEST